MRDLQNINSRDKIFISELYLRARDIFFYTQMPSVMINDKLGDYPRPNQPRPCQLTLLDCVVQLWNLPE